MSRTRLAFAVLGFGGLVIATDGLGTCAMMGTQAVSGAVDFCFLFDCTDGILGGLIDPCSPIFGRPGTPGFIPADPDKAGQSSGTLFSDCPDQQTP